MFKSIEPALISRSNFKLGPVAVRLSVVEFPDHLLFSAGAKADAFVKVVLQGFDLLVLKGLPDEEAFLLAFGHPSLGLQFLQKDGKSAYLLEAPDFELELVPLDLRRVVSVVQLFVEAVAQARDVLLVLSLLLGELGAEHRDLFRSLRAAHGTGRVRPVLAADWRVGIP